MVVVAAQLAPELEVDVAQRGLEAERIRLGLVEQPTCRGPSSACERRQAPIRPRRDATGANQPPTNIRSALGPGS